MREFQLPTRLPRINCSICGATAPYMDGLSPENLLTSEYRARKKTVQLLMNLWDWLGDKRYSMCSFGGSTDSPGACHIWFPRSKSSMSVILALPPFKKESILLPQRVRWFLESSPPSRNSSDSSSSNASMPDYDVPGLKARSSATLLSQNSKPKRYVPCAENSQSARSQLAWAWARA